MRIRPGRGSRPRSRLRPAHATAVPAMVTAVDRGRYLCRVQGGPAAGADLLAVRARELGRRSVVVGDEVFTEGDGGVDTLARIVRLAGRSSVLRRTADDADPIERVLVANADQMAVVASLADPAPSPGLIDRCLAAACDAGIAGLLVLSKADLAPWQRVAAPYPPTGVGIVVLGESDGGRGLAELAARLAGHRTVFVGHSGVGKSTIVNRLVAGAGRATGTVNRVTGRGRHISSSAVALQLPGGGWVIDTPGVRSFGLAHLDAARLLAAFPDLAPGAAACPGDCDHLHRKVCALDAWVAARHAHPRRLASLRHLIRQIAPARR